MRIFLDANILFSAANPSGSIRQLLNIARGAGHECWADEHVIREAHRNLFLKQREHVADFERLLREIQCATKLPNLPLHRLEAPLLDRVTDEVGENENHPLALQDIEVREV